MNDIMAFLSSGSGSAENNLTLALSCAASSLPAVNGSDLPIQLTTSIRIIQALYGLLILSLGCFLNTMIPLLILKYKKLCTVSYSIAFQICVGNLLLTFTYGIPLVVSNIAGHWVFGFHLCLVNGVLFFMLTNVSNFLIVIYFIDLFFFIFSPFSYRKFCFWIAIILCGISWCFSIALSLTLLPGLLWII